MSKQRRPTLPRVESPTLPRAATAQPCNATTTTCPRQPHESDQPKSLHIDILWTFSMTAPTGDYTLTIDGHTFTGSLNSGQIRLDNQLDHLTGSGQLQITVTNGPIFRADVTLGLEPIQTPLGLKRRLTNLGYYAGTDATIDGRCRWAIRAFKRVRMNSCTRNSVEVENDDITQAFLEAVQAVYGAHPDDTISGPLTLASANRASTPCGMFGSRVCTRASFETTGADDDVDPRDAGDQGRWAGAACGGVNEPIAGAFDLHLRAFDPGAGEPALLNRVMLPQPIHMTQLVLFELGYWLVGGPGAWTNVGGIETRHAFTPDGGFGRYTQWAVREFQCHAKMSNAALEDVASTEDLFLKRLLGSSPTALSGAAQYPAAGRVSGALNETTRNALQEWADQNLRCPVIIYASNDNHNATANGSNLASMVKENLWLYDDHTNTAPRMYAIDYSGYYTIPAAYGGNVTVGSLTFPRPITVGEYVTNMDGGPLSHPARHSWQSQDAELRPDTLIGLGGGNGTGLTAAQLSTFKVVRTAAHFECLGYFDVFNAYDDVTISFGPCHWTLAVCSGGNAPNDARELPAFLSYFNHANAAEYRTLLGAFGLSPQTAWPIVMSASTGTYSSRILFQTEAGTHVLCGASGSAADRQEENKYGKSWHWFYRFQMGCRTSAPMRHAMWDFSRLRIQAILDKTFTIAGTPRRVGDYVTSEKGVAMLLRWHIYRPGHLFRPPSPGNPNHLLNILTTVITAHPAANQARETAMIQEIDTVGGPVNAGITEIRNMTNIPQQGTRPYYHLNLTAPTLSDHLNSFQFATP